MKTCLIVPYFGKFPNYFQLVLNSMAKNPDYDWLIFTDDKFQYDYPTNVHVHYTTFEDMKKLFQSRFEFKIVLERPYKFCDFKPAYGYIFSDYLKEYDFWGHCDIDCIFGQLNHFITEDMLAKYDKIFSLGHLTLYRNTEENNKRFMLPLDGSERYKEVFTSNNGFIFDEAYDKSINNIFINNKFSFLNDSQCADIYQKSSDFRLVVFGSGINGSSIDLVRKQLFIWDNGITTRTFLKKDKLYTEEFPYVHLQKRKMKYVDSMKEMSCYKIIPHTFEPVSIPMSIEDFKKERCKYFNLHYFRLRFKNLKVKIKRKLKGAGL